jgi:hypothetical protein
LISELQIKKNSCQTLGPASKRVLQLKLQAWLHGNQTLFFSLIKRILTTINQFEEENQMLPRACITHLIYKFIQEEFEGTKGVIRIRISKNRQHNGQKKK